MALSIVQKKKGSGTTTNLTITPTSAPTAGNLGVVVVAYAEGLTNSVAGITQTNCTWTQVTSDSANFNSRSIELWYTVLGTSPGSSLVVGMDHFVAINAEYFEVSGTAAAPLNTSGHTNGTSASTGSLTSTTANTILIGGWTLDVNNGVGSVTNSFTLQDDFTASPHLTTVTQIVSVTGSYSSGISTWSDTVPSSYHSAGVLGAFKMLSVRGTKIFLSMGW